MNNRPSSNECFSYIVIKRPCQCGERFNSFPQDMIFDNEDGFYFQDEDKEFGQEQGFDKDKFSHKDSNKNWGNNRCNYCCCDDKKSDNHSNNNRKRCCFNFFRCC